MKKKVFALLLVFILTLSISATAFGEHYDGAAGWTVTFTSDAKMESNFSSGSVQDAVSTLQPGDDVTLTITLANKHKEDVNWYMKNTIIKSLEDSTTASGGAYTYVLSYSGSDGSTELYNSDRVGGNLGTKTAPEGLHEVDTALKDYFFLETMPSGGTGKVTLTVTLEGETQGNDYQKTLADLTMQFAAELTPTRTVVRTGDTTSFNAYYIGMGITGLLLLALAVDGLVQKRKAGRKGV